MKCNPNANDPTSRDPKTNEPTTRDPKTSNPTTRDPKTSDPKKARVREARSERPESEKQEVRRWSPRGKK